MTTKRLRFQATNSSGEVSALYHGPAAPSALFVLAHGAGAGMEHPFLEAVAHELAGRGIATFRYQFPYMEAGNKRPNPPAILAKTVRNAVAAAAALPEVKGAGIPIFAGGKSMGGRMTSTAFAREPIEGVRGIIFLGFPLHAPGRDSADRAEHLYDVDCPMLFLQGTRDRLANLDLLGPVIEKLGRKASLHIIESGDHSFHVLKRSGRTDEEARAELVEALCVWVERTRTEL
ncbi:MAG: alpha/beta hydrolase [Gemmatimonadetes bacterium]|nr:alpha/beta hydrolase [Gemmatimonadota bacterium]